MKFRILALLLAFSQISCHAAETNVDRARVIMARLKNNASPLNGKIDPATGLKYVNAFVNIFAPQHIDSSNEVKATIYINALRKFHRDMYLDTQLQANVNSAIENTKTTITSEVENELGTTE